MQKFEHHAVSEAVKAHNIYLPVIFLVRSRPAVHGFVVIESVCYCTTITITMPPNDSDSSDESGSSTTNVLLGYASNEPTDDEFSQLGGYPV